MSAQAVCVEDGVEHIGVGCPSVPRRGILPADSRRSWLPVPLPDADDVSPAVVTAVSVWRERHRVNVARLDRQHRRIIAILDRAQYLQAEDRLDIETVFNVLAACLRRHFADEEHLLAAHGYAGLDRQKLEHERCLAELVFFSEHLHDERLAVPSIAFEQIRDRFARHLEVTDKSYELFLRARGCR